MLGIATIFIQPSIWPNLFQSSRIAVPMLIAAIALYVWRDGLEGNAMTIISALAVLTIFAACALALSDIVYLAKVILTTIRQWREAGHSAFASLQAGVRVLDRLTEPQSRAFMSAGLIGLAPLFLLMLKMVFTANARSRGRISKSGPWQAKWMGKRDIRYLRNLKAGLPLGLKDGNILRYSPDPAKGWRGGHHAAIAGTRAGKGVSVVIPAIIDHDGPVVVLDIKGENFAVTRRWRQMQGRHVVVLNPFGVIEPSKDSFNPLEYIRPQSLVRDIDVIAEGLVKPEPGNGAHFAELARQLVAATIEVVMSIYREEDRDLNAVADILLSPKAEDTLRSWAENPIQFGRRPSQAAAILLGAGENERGGVRTTLTKAFEWMRSDEMRSFLESGPDKFKPFSHLLSGRVDIFIVVPLDQIDQQAVFMRLVINMVLGTVVRQDGQSTVKKRILLVLDEFVRLGRMEKLLSIANVSAGAGIEALFITQDKGQVETVYGPNDTASIFGSCVTNRVFGLGRAEIKTAEWIANALGDQTVLTQSTQTAIKFGDTPKTSTSEHKQKLMTADQILELPPDEMLCLIGSKPPIRMKAIVSHGHASYRKKLDANPTRPT
ncbi:type IV secretory system conjugative DNA transfer family protein [Ochrobactrum sp. C6C9]|nr:type IV secretory system conjugative DNA transfer family protein [Ochrobactrum sp. C6C9]